jgi:hypothetical protein
VYIQLIASVQRCQDRLDFRIRKTLNRQSRRAPIAGYDAWCWSRRRGGVGTSRTWCIFDRWFTRTPPIVWIQDTYQTFATTIDEHPIAVAIKGHTRLIGRSCFQPPAIACLTSQRSSTKFAVIDTGIERPGTTSLVRRRRCWIRGHGCRCGFYGHGCRSQISGDRY